MKTIELYKFIENYDIEYHWNDNDVYMFVDNWCVQYFHVILDNTIFDDEGIECKMKDGYFCFEMKNICDYYGIELTDVFE